MYISSKDPIRVGIIAGCFTILHPGHIFSFQEAKKECDYLIALTNTDEYLLRKKGCVPIPLADRITLLSSIKFIDEVGFYSGDTEEKWVENFKENRLYKEFNIAARLTLFHDPEVFGNAPARTLADKIIYFPKTTHSVSEIFKKIRGANE